MALLPKKEENYTYTQSRELSWLRFNRRVLEEAGDETVPLLERLKFISIFTSNLDEFFMVRVGNLFDLSLVSPGEIDNKTGLTPAGQLAEIYSVIPGLIEIKNRLYANVTALLRREGVCDLGMEELSPEERKFVSTYYKAKILPVLSPQIVDARHKPTADDVTMANWFYDAGCPLVVAANKLDKLKKSEIAPNLELIRQTLDLREGDVLIPFSAEKGDGKAELMGWLAAAAENG